MIASDSIYFSLKNMDIALSFLVAMFVVFYPVLSKVIPVCLVYWRRPSWSLLLSSESGLSLCRRAQFDEIRLVELGVDWGVNAGWSRHRRGQGGGFRGSWARTRLLPGRTKELWVGARRVEIVMRLGLGLDRHPVTSGSWGFDVKSFLYVLNALPKRSRPPTPSWWSGGPWSSSSPSPSLHTYSCWLLIHQTNSNEIFLFDLDNNCVMILSIDGDADDSIVQVPCVWDIFENLDMTVVFVLILRYL